MKKLFLTVFAGVCLATTIWSATAGSGEIKANASSNRMLRDTIPGKTDTSSYPKRDTSSMPRIVDAKLK